MATRPRPARQRAISGRASISRRMDQGLQVLAVRVIGVLAHPGQVTQAEQRPGHAPLLVDPAHHRDRGLRQLLRLAQLALQPRRSPPGCPARSPRSTRRRPACAIDSASSAREHASSIWPGVQGDLGQQVEPGRGPELVPGGAAQLQPLLGQGPGQGGIAGQGELGPPDQRRPPGPPGTRPARRGRGRSPATRCPRRRCRGRSSTAGPRCRSAARSPRRRPPGSRSAPATRCRSPRRSGGTRPPAPTTGRRPGAIPIARLCSATADRVVAEPEPGRSWSRRPRPAGPPRTPGWCPAAGSAPGRAPRARPPPVTCPPGRRPGRGCRRPECPRRRTPARPSPATTRRRPKAAAAAPAPAR